MSLGPGRGGRVEGYTWYGVSRLEGKKEKVAVLLKNGGEVAVVELVGRRIIWVKLVLLP